MAQNSIERTREMNIDILDGLIIPIITAACMCIGYVMKKWLPTDDKYIPTVLLILGAISGLIVFGCDYEGIVKGMVSGLAAVGMHQAFHQYLKIDTFGELTDEEASMMMEDMAEEDFDEDDEEEGSEEEA